MHGPPVTQPAGPHDVASRASAPKAPSGPPEWPPRVTAMIDARTELRMGKLLPAAPLVVAEQDETVPRNSADAGYEMRVRRRAMSASVEAAAAGADAGPGLFSLPPQSTSPPGSRLPGSSASRHTGSRWDRAIRAWPEPRGVSGMAVPALEPCGIGGGNIQRLFTGCPCTFLRRSRCSGDIE